MARENVFLLTDTKALTESIAVPPDDGIFLLYQSCGSAEISCRGEHKLLSQHDIFIGRRDRGYTVSETVSGSGIYISACGTLVDALTELYGIEDGFSASAPETRELFEEIRLTPEKKLLTETEKQNACALAFHRLMQAMSRSAKTRLVRRTALRIKDYIDAHVEEKTELSELSKVFFMSKTQIHRLFREEYGISPIKYLIDKKIAASKKLLENKNLKISEIAESLSFSDARHFSKMFFKREGILPSEYRKNLR